MAQPHTHPHAHKNTHQGAGSPTLPHLTQGQLGGLPESITSRVSVQAAVTGTVMVALPTAQGPGGWEMRTWRCHHPVNYEGLERSAPFQQRRPAFAGDGRVSRGKRGIPRQNWNHGILSPYFGGAGSRGHGPGKPGRSASPFLFVSEEQGSHSQLCARLSFSVPSPSASAL